MIHNRIPATIKYDSSHNPFIVLKNDEDPALELGVSGYQMVRQGYWKKELTPEAYNETLKNKRIQSFKSMVNYPFPAPPMIKPRENQPVTAQFMVNHKRAWCLNGMRSGKTLSIAWAIDFLIRAGVVSRVIILCPLTILHDVWEPALMQVSPHRRAFIASGSVDELVTVANDRRINIIVMNHDKLKFATKAIDVAFDPDLVVLDECGPFRDSTTARVKALRRIVGVPGESPQRLTRRRFWPMTASPNPQKPTDVWALARLVNPDAVPATFKEFRNKTMYQPTMGVWAKRSNWKEVVQKALEPSICYATEDCIDLPPQGYATFNVPFTPKQSKMMKELMEQGVSLLRNIDTGRIDGTVAASNAAVLLVKLLQIAGGVVKDSNGKPVHIGADKRIKQVGDLADEALDKGNSKMVLMCVYRAIQPYIQDKLRKRGYDSVIIHGGFSGTKRKQLLDEFRSKESKRILILHPAVGKYGLDLTQANLLTWYLPTFKADEFIQGNARCQGEANDNKRKTTVAMLQGCPQEKRIYNRLRNQDIDQRDTVEIFRGLVEARNETM